MERRTMSAVQTAKINGDVELHISIPPDTPIPKPEEGAKLLDFRGDTIQPRPASTFMARLNEKTKETVTINKSTLWLVAVIPAFLTVAFLYVSSAMGWARDDQAQKERLFHIQTAVEQMNLSQQRQETKYDQLAERLRQQELIQTRLDTARATMEASR